MGGSTAGFWPCADKYGGEGGKGECKILAADDRAIPTGLDVTSIFPPSEDASTRVHDLCRNAAVVPYLHSARA